MSWTGLRLQRPSDESLREYWSAAKHASPSYPEVGATRAEEMPDGYRHDRYEDVVCEGPNALDRAAEALFAWQAQVGAGIEVFPPGSKVEDGETVVLLLRAAGLWSPAACRVVYVLDEPDRVGFAYGTLPGHPECGEVAFVLSRDDDGHVRLGIRSFSRRVDPLARLGAPVARVVQKSVTQRYIRALADPAGR